MLIKRRKGWEIPESQATPEAVFLNRRKLLAGIGAAGIAGALPWRTAHAHTAPELYPAKRNPAFTLGRDMTDEKTATTYNNFYEFGSHKRIADAAQKLTLRPWEVKIDGMVAKEVTLDAEELIRKMPVEERLYRLRCVEAWAMALPWTGFPLRALVDFAQPQSGAKYVRMETFLVPVALCGRADHRRSAQ
jgi:methionine sulfoxide reductase catalytic subunit